VAPFFLLAAILALVFSIVRFGVGCGLLSHWLAKGEAGQAHG